LAALRTLSFTVKFMNIGITVYPTYGGSGIVGSELGKELAVRGHTVHFIASALPTRLTELNERVRFHEVEMMSYPLFEHQPYTLALATKMATVAETENLDLLHVHYAIPHSISAILARESLKPHRRLPVVTTLHGTGRSTVSSRPVVGGTRVQTRHGSPRARIGNLALQHGSRDPAVHRVL
jgi:N-acetyl-alpha-D-glucosaminyl L-malate synthase BshA